MHAPVDEHTVLRRAGAVGPAPADLDADRPTVRDARARAPVPGDVVGPATAAVVEHGPRLPRRDGVGEPLDGHGSRRGERDILHRVLEAPRTPRHDDGEAVVVRRPGHGHVERRVTVEGRTQARRVARGLDVDRETGRAGSGGAGVEVRRQRHAARRQHRRRASPRALGRAVVDPHLVHGGVVERRHGEREDVRGRHDVPVLPALVAPPRVPGQPGGVDEGAPRPPHGIAVEHTPVAGGEGDDVGQLALDHASILRSARRPQREVRMPRPGTHCSPPVPRRGIRLIGPTASPHRSNVSHVQSAPWGS